VRLACVKRAANVRSEPGSNSPVEYLVSLRTVLSEESVIIRLYTFLFGISCLSPERPENLAESLPHSVSRNERSGASCSTGSPLDCSSNVRTIQFSKSEGEKLSVCLVAFGVSAFGPVSLSAFRLPRQSFFSLSFGLFRDPLGRAAEAERPHDRSRRRRSAETL
jgi:hypothetical protein